MNFCSVPIMDDTSIDAIKRVLEDYPNLNLKYEMYEYYEERWAYLNKYFTVVLTSPVAFFLLNALKNQTDPWMNEKVLRTRVDEDFYFRKLDSAGVVSELGPPITSPTPPPSP